jgi:heme-degrading monooxygenase HmoA
LSRGRRRVIGCAPDHPRGGEASIIRVFRPTIHPGKEREFETFLRDTAIPLVSEQAGLVAQQVGRPRDPSSTEYLYGTVWEDVESIRAFAGERWQEAVITPDEEHLRDIWIGHYEVLPTPTRISSRCTAKGSRDEAGIERPHHCLLKTF